MTLRIARRLLTAAGMAALAGAPALFAGDFDYDHNRDLRHDYHQVARESADIRADRYRLREDLEDGRYRDAARVRADINRDYRERDRQVRDIRHDRRDWR